MKKLVHLEDDLHEAAIRKTGFDDFGDSAYREGLHALLNAFDNDLQLTDVGRRSIYNDTLRVLIARLYTQRGWSDHPEVLRISIHRPLIIIGLPRTGTTALHKLLALDRQFQGLEYWLSETPMVRPPRETWGKHPAYRACVAHLEELYSRLPTLRGVHETLAGDVDECTPLFQNFVNDAWTVVFGLPTYARWFSCQNTRQSYRRFMDVLRLIGERESHKRWLLKDPIHVAEIDSLLEVFPDACIIHTHRDPLESIPSYCSLLCLHGRDLQGDAVRQDVLGRRQCTYWSAALNRVQLARKSRPTQFLDVDHRRFRADPLSTIQSIYAYFGFTLSSHVEQQMRARAVASPTSKYGRHEYALDSWGVAPEEIGDIFADYRERFGFTKSAT